MATLIVKLAISRPKFIFGCDPRHQDHQELQHVRGWSRGNQGERQEAVRPTYVVKISWFDSQFTFGKSEV